MTGQVGWRESSLGIGIHGDMLTNLKTNHNNTSQKTFKAPPPSLPFHSESRKGKSSSKVDRGGRGGGGLKIES